MARGRAKTVDQKLEEIRSAIDKAEEKVAALREQEEELMQLKRNEEINALYHCIQEHGLTVDQVMEMMTV